MAQNGEQGRLTGDKVRGNREPDHVGPLRSDWLLICQKQNHPGSFKAGSRELEV